MITFTVASLAVMVIVAFALNKKVSCDGLLRGGGLKREDFESILKQLYLNDYAVFNSKNSYIMFSHYYLLACKISTVKTLALGVVFCYFHLEVIGILSRNFV